MTQSGNEKIALLSEEKRKELFQESAAQLGMKPASIEKDFWVCWALQRIFSDQTLNQQLLFKGGTSLSKCYNLIERFSEDIDLILDWRLITDSDPYEERSNTKQDRFNKAMEQDARSYIGNELLGQLKDLFDGYELNVKPDSPKSILLSYPLAFRSNYIKPQIELEFGPMSAMTPNNRYTIAPYCQNAAPKELGELNLEVRSIKAVKTFWDKVTILHCEAHRPEHKTQQARYSRHYYDLYRMLNSDIKQAAMENQALLTTTFKFKQKFYPQGFAKYQNAIDGHIRLIPPEFRQEALQKDYKAMNEMIYGDYPSWELIMKTIKAFEQELANS
ncbi:nucleotidyl transferase AbiEii/AbiGii toxin family protein [Idiomarina loihiensis]|uniref:nucleotidyl transferase AbiEii/AbiGii toxin family protein n=1 Tax=Idiomarina loihiensis TaxID=135577 RepID=UPI0039BDFB09